MLALVCLRSGLMKIPGMAGEQVWIRDFARWGYPDWFRIVVGIAELVSFLLLLVPPVAGFGAGIFAVIMLGAIFTHATHNEFSRLPFNLLLLIFSVIVIYVRKPAFKVRPAFCCTRTLNDSAIAKWIESGIGGLQQYRSQQKV